MTGSAARPPKSPPQHPPLRKLASRPPPEPPRGPDLGFLWTLLGVLLFYAALLVVFLVRA